MRSGFTLVEMLVALAVFGLFLGGLLQAERAFRSAEADEDQALREQQKQAVVELLRAELAMAGYRLDGPGVQALVGGGSDRVTIRYLEDRMVAEPFVRTVAFDAGQDRSGVASLYRREGLGYRQPAVAGVAELRVLAWLDGSSGGWSASPPPRPQGVVLELRFSWDERVEVTIGFVNDVAYGELAGA